MARLILFIKYFLAILLVAILGLVATLTYYDVKYFQPTLKRYDLALAMPESLPRLVDAEAGNTLSYSVARILLNDSNYHARGHVIWYIWGNYVSLHLSRSEQHAIFASRAYLANNIHGFQQASKHFYGKDLLDISPQQAALLVARAWSPSYATKYPEKIKNRAQGLLSRAGYDI